MTEPTNLPPVDEPVTIDGPYGELLRQVAEYTKHFGNEARYRDDEMPTLSNVLIDKLAHAVRALSGERDQLGCAVDRARRILAAKEETP